MQHPCLQIIRFRVSMTPKLAFCVCVCVCMHGPVNDPLEHVIPNKKPDCDLSSTCFSADISPLSSQPSNQSPPDKINPRLAFFLVSLANMSNYKKWAATSTCVDFGRYGNHINACFPSQRLKSAVRVACFHFLTCKSQLLLAPMT